jgi:hypothetical protein
MTVAKKREHWVKRHTLDDAYRAGRGKKLDGKQEAFVVALACSNGPDNQEKWTMQLLAYKLVELGVVAEPISDELLRGSFRPWAPTAATAPSRSTAAPTLSPPGTPARIAARVEWRRVRC